MKTPLIYILCLLNFSACLGQAPKTGPFRTYEVGRIDSLESFMNFTAAEKYTDSIYKIGDHQIDSIQSELEARIVNKNSDTAKFLADAFAGATNHFSSNRARIFINGVRNGKTEKGNPRVDAGLPAVCKCFQIEDSISVEFAFGFGGGIAVRQQIVGSLFHTNVSVITRHAEIYKARLSDKAFKSEVDLVPLAERMTLLNKPTMHLGEQLTGFVIIQSKPYFENAGERKADTVSMNLRYLFTCKTQKKLTAPKSGFASGIGDE